MLLEGSRRVAVIDHLTVETGNAIARTHGPYIYRWRVTRIGLDGVDIEPLDARRIAH